MSFSQCFLWSFPGRFIKVAYYCNLATGFDFARHKNTASGRRVSLSLSECVCVCVCVETNVIWQHSSDYIDCHDHYHNPLYARFSTGKRHARVIQVPGTAVVGPQLPVDPKREMRREGGGDGQLERSIPKSCKHKSYACRSGPMSCGVGVDPVAVTVAAPAPAPLPAISHSLAALARSSLRSSTHS